MAASHNPQTDDRAAAANDEAQLDTERRRLAEALSLAERDRQLLGFEFHDAVVQDLTAAAMLLEGAGRQATFASPEVESSYAGGLRLLQQGIAEARLLIRGSSSLELDAGGLLPALARLVEKFRADMGLPVRLVLDAGPLKLPVSVEHLLLRITQESLYNVWKHARATDVEVRLARDGERLELCIADNGVGFEPAQLPAGHFGLDGIRARAAVLGAHLLFDTAPQHGTRVLVQLTVPPAV